MDRAPSIPLIAYFLEAKRDSFESNPQPFFPLVSAWGYFSEIPSQWGITEVRPTFIAHSREAASRLYPQFLSQDGREIGDSVPLLPRWEEEGGDEG